MSPVSGKSFGETPGLDPGVIEKRKRRYEARAPGRKTAAERKRERD